MRYNSLREKNILRSPNFERYMIKVIEEFMETGDEKVRKHRMNVLKTLPKKYLKYLKYPEKKLPFAYLDDKIFLLNSIGVPTFIISGDKNLARDTGSGVSFSKTLRKKMVENKENPYKDSFVLTPEPYMRYFHLIGMVQNSLSYMANHDWEKIKKGIATPQSKVDSEFQKAKDFMFAFDRLNKEKDDLQKIFGITFYEIRILFMLFIDTGLTFSLADVSLYFHQQPSSRYAKLGLNALGAQGLVFGHKIDQKGHTRYSITTKGWEKVVEIINFVFQK